MLLSSVVVDGASAGLYPADDWGRQDVVTKIVNSKTCFRTWISSTGSVIAVSRTSSIFLIKGDFPPGTLSSCSSSGVAATEVLGPGLSIKRKKLESVNALLDLIGTSVSNVAGVSRTCQLLSALRCPPPHATHLSSDGHNIAKDYVASRLGVVNRTSWNGKCQQVDCRQSTAWRLPLQHAAFICVSKANTGVALKRKRDWFFEQSAALLILCENFLHPWTR